jgi:hypothetical protein
MKSRAGVDCIVKNEFDNTSYGPWVAIGDASTALCGSGARVADYWYEIA